MKSILDPIITPAIQSRIFPGCVIGMIDIQGNKHIAPFGKFTYEIDSPAMKEDSIFDVASITKSIPTASLALMALEQGLFSLETRVHDILPELQTSFRDQVRIKHLLTHTLDIDLTLSSCKDLPPGELLAKILSAPLRTAPGSRFVYCNATSIILGMVVEKVMRDTLGSLAVRYFFSPLGMTKTSFNPHGSDAIVPTENDAWRGRVIQGEVHDESAWVLRKIMTPGSAGLFSTVSDLLTYLAMILNNGTYHGRTYFSEAIIRQMSTNQLANSDMQTGLGWELNQRHYMGVLCSDRTIGKTGFTGCVVAADLQNGVGIVFLSNYTWPQRKKEKDSINQCRSQVIEAILSSKFYKNVVK